MNNSTIKKVYDIISKLDFSTLSDRKQKQVFNFKNELENRVIDLIANDNYLWIIDFDKNEWDNLPNNWDDLNSYERADFLFHNSAWILADWLEYYRYEFEY